MTPSRPASLRSWAATRSASSTTASETGSVAGSSRKVLVASVEKAPGPGLVVEVRADRRQPVVEQPQQRPIDQRQRDLGRHRLAELVDGRHLDLDLLARPDRPA